MGKPYGEGWFRAWWESIGKTRSHFRGGLVDDPRGKWAGNIKSNWDAGWKDISGNFRTIGNMFYDLATFEVKNISVLEWAVRTGVPQISLPGMFIGVSQEWSFRPIAVGVGAMVAKS